MAIQWYFRPADIPADVRPAETAPNELFTSMLVDTNPVTALVGPARVLYGAAATNDAASAAAGAGVFRVTRQYHHETHALTACTDMASGAFLTGFRVSKSLVRRPDQALAARLEAGLQSARDALDVARRRRASTSSNP